MSKGKAYLSYQLKAEHYSSKHFQAYVVKTENLITTYGATLNIGMCVKSPSHYFWPQTYYGVSSKYQNVCKFTKLSLLAIDMIWSNSTQPNTYVSNIAQMQPRPLPSIQGISSQKRGGSSSRDLAVSKISDFTSGGSSSRNLAVSRISNCKNGDSSSCSLAVSKISNFTNGGSPIRSSAIQEIFNCIQWPPKKVATMQTVANSN